MHRPSASSQIFGTQRSCMIRAQGQRAGSTDRCLALACRGLDDSGRHRDGTGGGRLLARVAAGAPRAASAEPTFVCSRRCVMVDSARRCASWRQTQCRWIGTKGAHAFGAHGARLEGHVHCCRVVLPCVACHALCRPCHGACPQVDLAHGPVGDACAHRWRRRRARPIEQQWRACRAASACARVPASHCCSTLHHLRRQGVPRMAGAQSHGLSRGTDLDRGREHAHAAWGGRASTSSSPRAHRTRARLGAAGPLAMPS